MTLVRLNLAGGAFAPVNSETGSVEWIAHGDDYECHVIFPGAVLQTDFPASDPELPTIRRICGVRFGQLFTEAVSFRIADPDLFLPARRPSFYPGPGQPIDPALLTPQRSLDGLERIPAAHQFPPNHRPEAPFAMNPEKFQFFSQRFLPGRLTVTETAWYLGFGEHDIYVLVHYKLLTPLGRPVQNCTKYFTASPLEKIRFNLRWYDRATALLTHHRRVTNGRPALPNPLLKSYFKPRKTPASRRKSRPESP